MKKDSIALHPHLLMVHNIQSYRVHNSMSTKQLADKLEIGQSYLLDILDGEVSPTLSLVYEFSRKMEIPFIDLFRDAEGQ